MPYCWKTEYYVYEDDEAINWCDTLEEARAYAASHPSVTHIDEVRHYQDDTETVWEAE